MVPPGHGSGSGEKSGPVVTWRGSLTGFSHRLEVGYDGTEEPGQGREMREGYQKSRLALGVWQQHVARCRILGAEQAPGRGN